MVGRTGRYGTVSVTVLKNIQIRGFFFTVTYMIISLAPCKKGTDGRYVSVPFSKCHFGSKLHFSLCFPFAGEIPELRPDVLCFVI